MEQNIERTLRFVAEHDPEVAEAMEGELRRQQRNLELIASENLASPAVMAAMGSVLTNKYAEGYPGRRYYGGCAYVDVVETLAIERARALFHAEHANVQPHSGAQANLAVYFALLEPGDTVLGMSLQNGGHLTHGMPINLSGKYYHFESYGVDAQTGRIDYDEVARIAARVRPKLIVAGASAYPRTIDFARFADIAHDAGALLMVDMAHIAGLVAAGVHPSPVPYADVVTSTTHKTLRGPRGGLILSREPLAKAIDRAVFPGTQGGPLMHVIAAKAVCFQEALQPSFAEYQRRIVENAKALADGLLRRGMRLVSGGTDNHLMLLDLRGLDITGKELERRLDTVYITVNKNTVPDDPQKPFVTSGVRIGTPAVDHARPRPGRDGPDRGVHLPHGDGLRAQRRRRAPHRDRHHRPLPGVRVSGAAEGADAKADKESRAPASAGALLRASPPRHAAREGERRAPLCAGAPRRGEKREGGGRAVRRRAAHRWRQGARGRCAPPRPRAARRAGGRPWRRARPRRQAGRMQGAPRPRCRARRRPCPARRRRRRCAPRSRPPRP